jgi:hypothetical protein
MRYIFLCVSLAAVDEISEVFIELCVMQGFRPIITKINVYRQL